MRLEYQILAAVGMDLLIGDPRWLPHPVRGIGWLAARIETVARWAIRPQRIAGIVAALLVYSLCGAATWTAVWGAGQLHPYAGDAVAVAAIYVAIAARDLARHSMAVYRPLARGDLSAARSAVAQIVGRDTDALDESGVTRAAIESVAESTVDGVTAPLFYAVLFGPVGAIVYRAANTLDSMFGHKDERYLRFGWASARFDDVLNFVPARLTGALMCVSAALLGRRAGNACRVLVRDAHRHESPNAGWPEAAMAGALGVQLGGMNVYAGEPLEKPTIGQAIVPLTAAHICWANALMFTTAGLFLTIALAARYGMVQ